MEPAVLRNDPSETLSVHESRKRQSSKNNTMFRKIMNILHICTDIYMYNYQIIFDYSVVTYKGENIYPGGSAVKGK